MREFNFCWNPLLFDPSLSIALELLETLTKPQTLKPLNQALLRVKFLNYGTIPKASPHQRETQIPLRIQATYSFAPSFVLQLCGEKLYLFSLFIYLLSFPETKAYSHHFIFV